MFGLRNKLSCYKVFHGIQFFHGFILYIKTDDIYKDIAEDVETTFDTSNYELDRPLPKDKNEKVIGLTKDELGRKICWTKNKNLKFP